MFIRPGCFAVLGALFAFGCSGEPGGGAAPGPSPTSTTPGIPSTESPPGGVPVSVTQSSAAEAEIASVKQALSGVTNLDESGFATRYATPHVASLGYDPKTAAGLDLIAASAIAPSAAELDALGKNGFVISETHRFPTFTYGYETIYSADLPLYVSADSILNAVHRSYDGILETMETGMLIPELGTLLKGLRTKLGAATTIPTGARADVDFYLAVALSLLDDGTVAAPVAGASQADIAAFVSKAKAATASEDLTLFGVVRHVDLSQFTPRGHYTDAPELGAYFRAMMWLGRIDFRIIETKEDHSQVFNRRQFDSVLAIASLFDSENVERHRAIDDVIQAFVGESDNMQVKDVGPLLAALGAPPGAVTVNASDEQIAQTILDGGYGAQRIASQIMINGLNAGTLPLDRSFLIYGQRYVLDSHVFSNVVYDRVQGGNVMRMMPNPLDAAFAALGNNDAGALLAPELTQFHYASDLASMRVLADAHGDEFWGQNLYNLWLSSLRGLSPDGVDPASAGMPAVTGTEPWGRRILNTQLASWAELRHDTILYAKQSYTGGNACEFPDAYVDPYPEFYAALKRFADYAAANIVPLAARGPYPDIQTTLASYFQRLGSVAQMLSEMATFEKSGTPFNAEQMAFINDAVTIDRLCGQEFGRGWYPQLVYGDPMDFDPTIADVHTQPFDPGGIEVGKVLHVGTGSARLMIVTANTCNGPRAYVGLASSYFEKVTEKYERLTDPEWAQSLSGATPPDVPWMADLVVR